MAAVMIGVDPHKGSHTAVAIGAAEEPLGELRVRSCAAQAERLLAWAAAWPERTWAVEGAGRGDDLLKAHPPGPPSPTDRNLSSWPEGPCPCTQPGDRFQPQVRSPPVQPTRTSCRPTCHRRSVREAGANFPRPERRSTDGQMILTVAPAGRTHGLDLLVYGAPLRNRTVDLLLTIWTFLGSLPNTEAAGPAAADPARSGPAAGRETCRPRETARVSPGPANGGIMGASGMPFLLSP